MIYNIFDNFLKYVIKYRKKSEKEILYKVWLKYNKNKSYKAKKHGIYQILIIKEKHLYKIINIYSLE